MGMDEPWDHLSELIYNRFQGTNLDELKLADLQ